MIFFALISLFHGSNIYEIHIFIIINTKEIVKNNTRVSATSLNGQSFIVDPSSETQGQIVRARGILNCQENMARRKVKNGEKSPLGQCLTRPVPNGLIGARKLLCFSAQSEARTTATVWNWSGKTLSPGALLAVLYFSSCHIFPPV